MSKPVEEKVEEEQEIEEVPRQEVQLPSYSKALQLVNGQTSLSRIPIFALCVVTFLSPSAGTDPHRNRFHNSSANTLNGAPHSFSAFLKCYPSLPQVVVRHLPPALSSP